MLYGFTKWLQEQAKKYGFTKLFFLARDMHFVMEIYKNIFGSNALPCVYLYSSRQSLKPPYSSITNKSKNSVDAEQVKILLGYLESQGFTGNIAVIDTGWNGASQVMLERIAKAKNKRCDVGGLYLGCSSLFKHIKRSAHSASYLNSGRAVPAGIWLHGLLLETFIADNEPKTIAYIYDEGKEKPLFSDTQTDNIQNEKLHRGAKRFVMEWEASTFSDLMIDSVAVLKPFLRFVEAPEKVDMNICSKMVFDDDDVNSNLVNFQGKIHYLRHPSEWIHDLSTSPWKGAFFKESFTHPSFLYRIYLILDAIRLTIRDWHHYKSLFKDSLTYIKM